MSEETCNYSPLEGNEKPLPLKTIKTGQEMNFSDWKITEKHKGSLFISDGILDDDLWQKSQLKVLFLMKEAYESSSEVKEDWALNDYLNKPLSVLGKPMWWTMAQWLDGLDHLVRNGTVKPFNENYKQDANLDVLFQSCAIINIKKSAGKSSSNNEDLTSYVESDWTWIWQQIKRVNPDIIICGHTFPLIENKLKQQGLTKEGEWLYQSEGFYFVDFWHPSNQWPYKIKYYSLLTALEQSKAQWQPKTSDSLLVTSSQ